MQLTTEERSASFASTITIFACIFKCALYDPVEGYLSLKSSLFLLDDASLKNTNFICKAGQLHLHFL